MNTRFPDHTLIPFQTRQLANATLAYIQPGRPAIDWLGQYAYLIASELEQDSDFTSEHRTFFAERYGGTGISVNGGGARCGTDGRFQVKGIGRNQLAGERADFWHSHGGFTLSHALTEVIWGEVLQRALPHGATRCPALILTGTQCWIKGPKGSKQTTARALAVRDNALRPAHFERAVLFRAAPGSELASDTERVRSAVNQLPEFLPMPAETSSATWQALDHTTRLHAGLAEMVKRFAQQAAAAKAKRLMHGTLTSSNLALDGRWLDYGTVAALPSYANTKSYGLPPPVPTLWQEHFALLTVIDNLSFSVSKYYREEPAALPRATVLKRLFEQHYLAALRTGFVELAGFPQDLLAPHHAHPACIQLADALIAAARRGVEKPFAPNVVNLDVYGANPLSRWLPALACRCAIISEIPAAIVAAYDAVSQLIMGEATPAWRTLCALNAMRQARNMPQLYRQNIIDRCDHLSASSAGPAIQQWVEECSDDAEMVYRNSTGLRSLIWKRGSEQVEFDAGTGRWLMRSSDADITFALFHELPCAPAIRQYWGSTLDSILAIATTRH